MKEKGEFHSLLNDIPAATQEAFTYPPEKQRLLWYTDKLPKHSWNSVYFSETETHLYYSESLVAIKMAKVLYPTKTSRKGFTYDKKTKKIKTWYGSSINKMIHLPKFLEAYGLEWVKNEKLLSWLTKTLLEKIISKSITNPKEACQHIIKINRLKVSPEILRQYIRSGNDKQSLLFVNGSITDLNDYLRDPSKSRESFDLVKQAKALGRIFDWTWSSKRLNDLHTEWTREIMKAEIDNLEEEVIDLPDLQLPRGFELIKSKKRCFEEGMVMHHCIYTNYWWQISERRYIVLRVQDDDGNIATVGIHLNPIRLDQVKARFNQSPSQQIQLMVYNLMKDTQFLDELEDIQNSQVSVEKIDLFENIPF